MFGDFDWVVASDMRLSSHTDCYRLDLNEAEIAFGGNLNSWKLNAMDWLECIGVVETANRPNIVVFPWFDIFCPYWFDYDVAVFHAMTIHRQCTAKYVWCSGRTVANCFGRWTTQKNGLGCFFRTLKWRWLFAVTSVVSAKAAQLKCFNFYGCVLIWKPRDVKCVHNMHKCVSWRQGIDWFTIYSGACRANSMMRWQLSCRQRFLGSRYLKYCWMVAIGRK